MKPDSQWSAKSPQSRAVLPAASPLSSSNPGSSGCDCVIEPPAGWRTSCASDGVNVWTRAGGANVLPQSVDLAIITASGSCFDPNWRNVTYTCPLCVTEMSGNWTSWIDAEIFIGFENVTP